MRAPEITYRYTAPKDISSPTFEPFIRATNITQATPAAINTTVLGIPKDRILVLSNVAVLASPGALIKVSDIQINGFTHGGQVFVISAQEFTAIPDAQDEAHNWNGEIYILGRGVDLPILQIHTLFDGADAANNQIAGICGIVIPRGNASPF